MDFAVGTHVLIELVSDRKIAGTLVGGSLEAGGWLVAVTHKESEVVRSVPASMDESIREDLGRVPLWRLRASCVLTGNLGAAFATRAIMETVMHERVVEDILAAADDGVQMRSLASPVMTFVSSMAVETMESTVDRAIEYDVSRFDQDTSRSAALEAELEKIFEQEKDDGKGSEEDSSEPS